MSDFDAYIKMWFTFWAIGIVVGAGVLGAAAFFIGRCSV